MGKTRHHERAPTHHPELQCIHITKIGATIIGAGMIAHDLILPAVYHLQRTGVVGDIWV